MYGYYSTKLEQLVKDQDRFGGKEALAAYIAQYPSEWEAFQKAQKEAAEKQKKQDDLKPGSDMHTWATTRFF